ncbi:MAG: aminomethyl-transferring glycine dehydrogenase subunit GcvPB [Synergistaceae bacterium]|jgi:glycine dehydrogenase subunit 2|nr:aminomethyl-transferring glycine dehydrogenase subunit GcvPB [Synergistaceae bacterium]
MKLSFEKSVEGRSFPILPALDVPEKNLPDGLLRKRPLRLPQMSPPDITRRYTQLAKRTHGVNDGFYPLGSCTMKYNPKLNDEMANLPGFTGIHPLQPPETAQGCLEALATAEKLLCEITGMDAMTFQPAAGAHGEFAGVLLIKAWHDSRGDRKRTKIIAPDSAHGTNPATAAMTGYQVVNIRSDPSGRVDLGALREAVGDDTAGLMLTNPNTAGVFEKNILEITKIIHDAGGLCYYDGANLNAIMGVARPGDMGFDAVHLNLHKTFSTPHGGGGPGAGTVGCKSFLAPFLPKPGVVLGEGGYSFFDPPQSVGAVKAFYGNFLVTLRALVYILTLGRDGLAEASRNAVLNANYMMKALSGAYDVAYPGPCMHEFVLTMEKLKKESGVSAMDVAKSMLDYGMHPPTMYFPLTVKEALMIEPTETESRETLDEAISVLLGIRGRADDDPRALREAPLHTPVRRVDEVNAARHPVLKYDFDNAEKG